MVSLLIDLLITTCRKMVEKANSKLFKLKTTESFTLRLIRSGYKFVVSHFNGWYQIDYEVQ